MVNRIEASTHVSYKIYLQDAATSSNRKGLVLLGDGNDENAPSVGGLDGGMLNQTAAALAAAGYVSAIVAYQAGTPSNPLTSDAWNANTLQLTQDFSDVADTIIAKYGMQRGRVISGGLSYTSYALLSNAGSTSPLHDSKGLLATCGATDTWHAGNFVLPVYSLYCAGSSGNDTPEGDFEGAALISAIGNASVKSASGFHADTTCNTHCGGSADSWSAIMVAQTQAWLP